jgi:DNA-directed RNA polymerase subunit RPC12/RpoP
LPDEVKKLNAKAVSQEVREEGEPLQCPRCGGAHMKRMRREGFFKRRICWIFGYYPWRCTKCLGNFLLKRRALPRRYQGLMPVAEQVVDSGGARE